MATTTEISTHTPFQSYTFVQNIQIFGSPVYVCHIAIRRKIQNNKSIKQKFGKKFKYK